MICFRCKIEKPLSEFHNDKRRPTGKYPYCKDCRRIVMGSKPFKYKEVLGYIDGFKIVEDADKRYLTVRFGKGEPKRLHIYLMEKKLGRPLQKGEVVHHINHNGQDNRIENLMLMSDHEHRVLHSPVATKAVYVYCNKCGTPKRYFECNLKKINLQKYMCIKCKKVNH